MAKWIKKIYIMFLMLLFSLVTGCSNNIGTMKNSNSSEEITLKVMTNRYDIVDTELKKIGEEYKEKTGVNIEWNVVEDYDSAMKTRIRANDNYGDVLIVPDIPKEEYSKYLEPLGKTSDSRISSYKINTQAAIEENGEYTVYGLSYGLGAQGIVYNKKTFEKIGISPENMKTIDGFYEGCAKLKENGIIPVATNFKDSWTLSNWYYTAQCMSGDPDFKNLLYKQNSIFDETKPMGDMLKFAETLISNGWVEDDLLYTDWEKSKQELAHGGVGMMFLGTWVIAQVKAMAEDPNDIGFMAVPTKDGNNYTLLIPDNILGVSNKSKHKKEAIDFLFAFNESSYAVDNGFIPNNQNLTDMDPVIREFLDSDVTEIVEEPVKKEDEGKTEEVFNKASINPETCVQKPFLYVGLGKEKFDKSIDFLNEDWNNAKKQLGY